MCRAKNPGSRQGQGQSHKYQNPRTSWGYWGHYSCGHGHCSGPESDYKLHEYSVQVVYTNQDSQTNIRFDEIEDSQALGDLTSNKSGKKVNQRFKLDS